MAAPAVAAVPAPRDRETSLTKDDRLDLRVWFRLLTCATHIERSVRQGLREGFGITLPRFDLLAQLDRAGEGLTMGELSRRLMVTNGNVTGLIDRLVGEGLVARTPAPHDRRAQVVRLTPAGKQTFDSMIPKHQDFIAARFQGLPRAELAELHRLLGKLKTSFDAREGQPVKRKDEVMNDVTDRGRIFGQMLADTTPRRGADFKPQHFSWQVSGKVATLTLNRPERKNPITFQSYAEMRDTFRALAYVEDVKAVIVTGAGGNFCSGGDVHEIIGPLIKMDMPSLLNFTRMTGDLIKAIRACPQVVIAAIDGICAGAGSCVAMAADLRLGTPRSSVAFLFNRVGLAGCDMGACAMLPRIIGQGRASELLFTGRAMKADEADRWGFYNRLVEPDALMAEAKTLAERIAAGPTFANGITKTMLDKEWNMGIDQFIEAEAQAQAICMQTEDFRRAYNAFVKKEKPVFEGN